MMDWKGSGWKRSWSDFKVLPYIRLEGLRKTTKTLCQGSRSPGRDFKPGSPENEAGVLTTRRRRSVVGRCCGKLRRCRLIIEKMFYIFMPYLHKINIESGGLYIYVSICALKFCENILNFCSGSRQ
jgi:hypothetical protein